MPDLSRRALLGAGMALGTAAVAGVGLPGTAHAAELPLIGPATGDQLHVMTFNLRVAVDEPPRSWAERRPLVKQLLEAEQPTLLGTQEGLYWQLQTIRDDFPSYDWIHLFREGGSEGEAMAVFYDTQRLKPVAYDHLWLSDTPKLIGSTTWGNTIPRMLTWVRFSDTVTDKEFILLNTHFDHQSAEAREHSAELVRDTVAGFDVPTLVTGDFNTAEGTPPYEILIDGGLDDTWDTADEQVTEAYQTFNAWEPEPVVGDRIDWLLSTPDTTVAKTAINTWSSDGQNPSDHWAVQSLLTLP